MGWTHVESWQAASAELGLVVSGPVTVTVDSCAVVADMLVSGFGGSIGTLVVSDSDALRPYSDELQAAGYGWSCFDPPGDGEQVSTDDVIELLRDWTWAGPPDAKPAWFTRA